MVDDADEPTPTELTEVQQVSIEYVEMVERIRAELNKYTTKHYGAMATHFVCVIQAANVEPEAIQVTSDDSLLSVATPSTPYWHQIGMMKEAISALQE